MRDWEVLGGLGRNCGGRGRGSGWKRKLVVWVGSFGGNLGGRIWMREEWVEKREFGEAEFKW